MACSLDVVLLFLHVCVDVVVMVFMITLSGGIVVIFVLGVIVVFGVDVLVCVILLVLLK